MKDDFKFYIYFLLLTSPYKTVIGDLTLNEVLVNYDKIMISATFDKNEETVFIDIN